MNVAVWCTGPQQTLVPGVLRGYRMWLFTDTRMPPMLSATNTRLGPWPAKVMKARCHRDSVELHDCPLCDNHGHAAPDVGCGCGLWGWYRPDETRINPGLVFGAVAVSGRVLLGDFGFRAEDAEILGLCYLGSRQDVRDGLAERYQVPVFDRQAALVDAFPPDDVRELVPTAFEGETQIASRFSSVWSLVTAVDPYETSEVTVDGVPLAEFELAEIRAQLDGGAEVFLRRRGGDEVVTSSDPRVVQALLRGRTPTWRPPRVSAVFQPPRAKVNSHHLWLNAWQAANTPPPAAPPAPVMADDKRTQLLELLRARNTGPKLDWRARLERIRR